MEPNVPEKCGVHCWHDTGVVLTSYPPQTEEVCCECGERRYVRGYELLVEKKHGPFAPNAFRFNPTPLDIETPPSMEPTDMENSIETAFLEWSKTYTGIDKVDIEKSSHGRAFAAGWYAAVKHLNKEEPKKIRLGEAHRGFTPKQV